MKVVIFLLITLFTFNARGQVPNDSQSLKTVKTKLEGKWKHDKKFRGKIWITTFKFNTDSTGTWLNNRTHSTAPIFTLREKNGKYYISAFDVFGGECDPREIFFLDSKKLILLDPKTKEKFNFKRIKKVPNTI
ncbi:hypothetical protein OAL26_01630 [Flavobacteriales bacterium]|nr:hypothetical protein [Flavobacteriales bacterium]